MKDFSAKQKAEIERISALYNREKVYYDMGYKFIAGMDEAGRGPLAGPVVAAAVILPPFCEILYVNDSKKLSAKKRELLYAEILEKAVAVGVGLVNHGEIDAINIDKATKKAMMLAVANLPVKPEVVLIDGNRPPETGILQESIVRGDQLSFSIAAASIVAKVTRDELMRKYDVLYPAYNFAQHKGYGTKAHIAAITDHGPCQIHRKTFIHF